MTTYGHTGVFLAQTVSYAIGVVNSYLLNRLFTFRRVGKARPLEFFRFLFINALSYLASLLALWLLQYGGIDAVISKFFVILLTFGINFIGNKWFVFQNNEFTKEFSHGHQSKPTV